MKGGWIGGGRPEVKRIDQVKSIVTVGEKWGEDDAAMRYEAQVIGTERGKKDGL